MTSTPSSETAAVGGRTIPMLCLKCKRTMDLAHSVALDVPWWVVRIEHDACDQCDTGDRSAEHWIAADDSEPDPATMPANPPPAQLLPVAAPGHWVTDAGREMAVRALDDSNMAHTRERQPDFQLANDVYLSPDIGNLTAAKERIRWLSAQLALAQAAPSPERGELASLVEALENFCRAAEYWAGCDEGCSPDEASTEIMSSGGAWPAEAYDRATATLHALSASPEGRA